MTKIDTTYTFKLFSYLSMAIITIAIIIGMIFLYQHHELVKNQNAVLVNQKLIQENTEKALENQALLKTLLNQVTHHEEREETSLNDSMYFGNSISALNSKKLDNITEKIDNLTKMVHDMVF